MWKNLPSWLKFGIVGLIIGVILIIIFYSANLFYNCENILKITNAGVCLGNPVRSLVLYSFSYISILSYPLFQVLVSPGDSIYTESLLLVGTLWFFIYGALVGLIVKKIKSKK